jgi:hypothetical protein
MRRRNGRKHPNAEDKRKEVNFMTNVASSPQNACASLDFNTRSKRARACSHHARADLALPDDMVAFLPSRIGARIGGRLYACILSAGDYHSRDELRRMLLVELDELAEEGEAVPGRLEPCSSSELSSESGDARLAQLCSTVFLHREPGAVPFRGHIGSPFLSTGKSPASTPMFRPAIDALTAWNTPGTAACFSFVGGGRFAGTSWLHEHISAWPAALSCSDDVKEQSAGKSNCSRA